MFFYYDFTFFQNYSITITMTSWKRNTKPVSHYQKIQNHSYKFIVKMVLILSDYTLSAALYIIKYTNGHKLEGHFVMTIPRIFYWNTSQIILFKLKPGLKGFITGILKFSVSLKCLLINYKWHFGWHSDKNRNEYILSQYLET
jgi:hypothetical protein